MKNLRCKTMHQFTITLACSFEGTENVRGDIGFGFDLETCLFNISVQLRNIGRCAEIGVKKMPTRAKHTIHRLEKSVLPRVAMRCLDVQDCIEMICREVQRLGIANAEINSKRAMRFTVVINSLGILVNCSVCFRMMIAFDKRGTTAMSTTDFEHILVREIPAACHMMIQLNGRAINLILRFKFYRFPFRRPIAIVEKYDRIVAYSPAEVLIPNFPECLL